MSLLTLPTVEGARLIVIDEGTEANHSTSVIAAWLRTWNAKDDRLIEILSFSGPQSTNQIYKRSMELGRTKIHDCYTLDVDHLTCTEAQRLAKILTIDFLKSNSVVIIDSLNALILCNSLTETCCFVQQLSERCGQLICVYQRDFAPYKIPSIETFGTSYVKLKRIQGAKMSFNRLYEAFVSHRKPGGSVVQQTEIVEQDVNSYKMTVEKLNDSAIQKSALSSINSIDKFQAPFRIEMNAREIEQRNATPLPYIRPSGALGESKIHYEMDNIDDLDEDDPDDEWEM